MPIGQLLFSFKGRATRTEFWLVYLSGLAVSTVPVLSIQLFAGLTAWAMRAPLAVFLLLLTFLGALLWIGIAIAAKRYHDLGKPDLWAALLFVPIIGLWAVIECGFFAGKPGPNQYGEDRSSHLGASLSTASDTAVAASDHPARVSMPSSNTRSKGKLLAGLVIAAAACAVLIIYFQPTKSLDATGLLSVPMVDAIAALKRGDNDAAIRIAFPLANRGDAAAQKLLGAMYYSGRGVTQDYAKSAEWYSMAANQGDAAAQTMLGTLCTLGRGVPQDYAKAVEWFGKSANQGDSAGQDFLGQSYEGGIGVPQDYVLAYMWFNLAAARLNLASEHRDAIATKMTSEQIAEAQKLTREWKPKAP